MCRDHHLLADEALLDFCAGHGITAEIELMRPDQINEALGRRARNDVRYRFVLDMTPSGSEPPSWLPAPPTAVQGPSSRRTPDA
ncbi:hypothetical protein ACWD7F_35590 [Streptomyces sp. NPDC005122]